MAKRPARTKPAKTKKGRPPLPADERRDIVLSGLFNRDEHQRVRRLARRNKKPISKIMREATLALC